MKSTLHGDLDVVIHPALPSPLQVGRRIEICRVRGRALGQPVNTLVSLDLETGEVLLWTPGGSPGAFRLGDLIAAQVTQQILAQRPEVSYAP